MRTPLLRRAPMGLALCSLVLLSATPGAAQVHEDSLAAERAALERYDLVGDDTLELLGALAARASSGEREAMQEARALRALVATDLLLIARIEPEHATLEPRLAAALGVHPADVTTTLHAELAALKDGVYRAVVHDALDALALADELADAAHTGSSHWGVRGDLVVLRNARASTDPSVSFDPCGPPAPSCPAPWSSWDPITRDRVGRIVAGSAAATRLIEARDHGDPLVAALSPSIDAARAELDALQVDPAVWLDHADGLFAADSGDGSISVDRLIVVGSDGLHALRAAPVVVRSGELRAVDPALEVGLARAFFAWPDIASGAEAVIRSGITTIAHTSELAVAPTQAAACDAVWRVLAEARRGGVERVALVRRAADGSLAGEHFALAVEPEADERGDVVVRVRPGYLAVQRDGVVVNLERARGPEGLSSDLPALVHLASRRSTRRMFVTYAPGARTIDVVRVALALSRAPHGTVTLAVR